MEGGDCGLIIEIIDFIGYFGNYLYNLGCNTIKQIKGALAYSPSILSKESKLFLLAVSNQKNHHSLQN